MAIPPKTIRLFLTALVAGSLAGCFDFELEETHWTEPPQERKSIGFDTTEGDFEGIFLPAAEREPALAVMKPNGVEPGGVIFVFPEGGTAELTANDEGRLGILSIDGHRFDFVYTDTTITVTHTAPEGTVTTEEFENTISAASYSRAAWDEPRRDDETLEQYVERQLRDLEAPFELNMITGFIKKKFESGYDKFQRIKKALNNAIESGKAFGVKVKNEVSCLVASRTTCADIAVSQAPQLMEQLPAIDPNGETSAGFNVTDEGIRPKRDEWDPLIIDGEISNDFTMVDVSCDESIFADMNPECPQYVAPGTSPGGCELHAAPEFHEYSYVCGDYEEYLRPAAGGGIWIFSIYQADGGQIRDQLDMNFSDTDGLYYYSVNDFEYDGDGREIYREDKWTNLSLGQSHHWIRTTSYAGGSASVTSTMLYCYPTSVSREKTTTTNGVTTTIYDNWYPEGDPNYDRTGCPTIADVAALGKTIAPDADMSTEYIHASEVYQRSLQDK